MRRAVFLAPLLAAALTALPVRAEQIVEPGGEIAPEIGITRLLGDGGALFEILSGPRGQVAPAFDAYPADWRLVALRVTRPGLPDELSVAPGSTDAPGETVVASALHPGGDGLLFAWRSADPAAASRLQLASWRSGIWSETTTVELPGLAADAPEPRLVVTRDTFGWTGLDGRSVEHARDLLHLLWWADLSGELRLLYLPLVMVDGAALDTFPVFDLGSVEQAAIFGGPTRSQVLRSLALVANGREPRLAVAFLSPRSGRLLGVELQLLPVELTDLADKARGHIIDLGAQLFPDDLPTLAELARGHVIDLSTALHPASAIHAADGVQELIAGAAPNGTVQALADKARGHIIDLISAPVRGGVATEAPATSSALFEVRDDRSLPQFSLWHTVKARALGSLPLPAGAGEGFQVLVSPRANALVVAWESGEGILSYSESVDGAFGDPLALPLGQLTADEAVALLARRLADR